PVLADDVEVFGGAHHSPSSTTRTRLPCQARMRIFTSRTSTRTRDALKSPAGASSTLLASTRASSITQSCATLNALRTVASLRMSHSLSLSFSSIAGLLRHGLIDVSFKAARAHVHGIVQNRMQD